MPVLAAPSFLVAALAVAVAVVALHLLAWRRPPPSPLPTARFVPPAAIRTVARDLRLRDRLLLAVRVLAVLLAGLALARPQRAPERRGLARVVLLDVSRRLASIDALRDSARAHSRGADHVSWVRVDSAAQLLPDTVIGAPSPVRGRLSAGLAAGLREANRLSARYARVEFVVVSPFAVESWDAATEPLRRSWAGEVTVVRVAARADDGPVLAGRAELPPVDDPIGAAFAVAGTLGETGRALRVTRAPFTAADSAHAERGGIVVSWPEPGVGDTSRASPAARAQVRVLTSGERATAGRFAPLPLPSSAATAVLRWGDGSPAATERPHGRGCLRDVGIAVPLAGDEVLRPGFGQLVRALGAPCGGGSAGVVDSARLVAWGGMLPRADSTSPSAASGDGAAASAARPTVAGTPPVRDADRDDPARWLLLAVAVALLVEWWLRTDRARVASGGVATSAAGAREAA